MSLSYTNRSVSPRMLNADHSEPAPVNRATLSRNSSSAKNDSDAFVSSSEQRGSKRTRRPAAPRTQIIS